jgi:hypothetical protein
MEASLLSSREMAPTTKQMNRSVAVTAALMAVSAEREAALMFAKAC